MEFRLVSNFKEAETLFSNLDYNKQKNVLKSAVRQTIKPVLTLSRRNLRANTNSITGNAYKSLGINSYRRKVGMVVGARIKQPYVGYYSKFLDSGTVDRYHKKNRKYIGKIKPNNFFEDAVQSSNVMNGESLQKNVIQAINKYIMKGKI